MEWVQKCGNGIDDIDIGIGDNMEVMVTNNQVAPPHGSLIGYFAIVVDGGRIT